MATSLRRLLLLVVAAAAATAAAAQPAPTVVFLPLDERFTTRDAFLNLARVTNFTILTPPTSILPSHKVPADLAALDAWLDANLPQADAAIISSELFLYGGLINSRCSNDSTDAVMARLAQLAGFKQTYPRLRLLVSGVVMRIPAYNGDFEEPWYWANYGYDLFSYSFFLDKFNHTQNQSDLNSALYYESLVPPHAVSEFVWRRHRNFNVSVAMLGLQNASGQALFDHLYITQDDNAQYGFNIEEANALRALVAQDSLQATVAIYPGADEVQLTMLSRLAVDWFARTPQVLLRFRDPTTVGFIPNYEGQPMIETLLEQLQAAGGVPTNSSEEADVLLLVNNFSTQQQLEAPNQPNNGSIGDYSMFTPQVQQALLAGVAMGFADIRYSNGADNIFVDYIESLQASKLAMSQFAYAGWNTDGNKLGCVISNALLLSLFPQPASRVGNAFFTSLRVLEDKWYQANYRQELVAYVNSLYDMETVQDLSPDLAFYERFMWKLLESQYAQITQLWDLPFQLDGVYFPWNRTFEIGFYAH